MKISTIFTALCLFAATALAGNEHTTFNGGIGTGNPCNATGVTLTGPVDVVVETNANNPQVSVHLQFKAEGSATNGDDYKLSFIANSVFDAIASFYDVPFHSVFVGKGKAPNFSATGNVRVFVNAGNAPTGASITSLSSSCTQ